MIDATGDTTDVIMDGLPEGLSLDQSGGRTPEGRELLGVDVATYDVGATLADPRTLVRTGAEIRAILSNPTSSLPARRMTLGDLPAELHIDYLGPRPNPGIADNCLGDISYTGTDSQLDLILEQFMGPIYDDNGTRLGDGCFPDTGRNATAGPLTLQIEDMPSLGFEIAAVHRDGSAEFRTRDAGGGLQTVGRVIAVVPVPDWVATFANNPLAIDDTLCPEDIACIKVNIDANPHFVNLRLRVDAIALTDVEVRTNVGVGAPKPTPPSGGPIDDFMWGLLPILGVRNESPISVLVQLFGEDDPTETNTMRVHIGCCMGTWSTANHDMTIPLDAYPALQTSFYGWQARQILDPGGGIRKFNLQDQELANNFGNKVHLHQPFATDDPVPFGPRFIEFPLVATNGVFDQTRSNLFEVLPDSVSYFVPNLYGMLAAQPADINGDDQPDFNPDNIERELWYARARLYQTNWYWYGLLHELDADLHGFYP